MNSRNASTRKNAPAIKSTDRQHPYQQGDRPLSFALSRFDRKRLTRPGLFQSVLWEQEGLAVFIERVGNDDLRWISFLVPENDDHVPVVQSEQHRGNSRRDQQPRPVQGSRSEFDAPLSAKNDKLAKGDGMLVRAP